MAAVAAASNTCSRDAYLSESYKFFTGQSTPTLHQFSVLYSSLLVMNGHNSRRLLNRISTSVLLQIQYAAPETHPGKRVKLKRQQRVASKWQIHAVCMRACVRARVYVCMCMCMCTCMGVCIFSRLHSSIEAVFFSSSEHLACL